MERHDELNTHNLPDFLTPQDYGTSPDIFRSWEDANKSGFKTKDSWLLENRKVEDGERKQATHRKLRQLSTAEGFLGVATSQIVVIQGRKLRIDADIPLYHETQTRQHRTRQRTKDLIAFKRMLGFSWLNYAELTEKWRTTKTNPDDHFPSSRRYFTSKLFNRHVNGSKIYGGFAGRECKFVALDLDFHDGATNRVVFLEVVRAIYEHIFDLMDKLGGQSVWWQADDNFARGVHLGFLLQKPVLTEKMQEIVGVWLMGLEKQHPALLQNAVASGLNRFTKIEIYPSRKHAFRLPYCRGRVMLLGRPLEPLEDGKGDVASFLRYAEGAKPMPLDDVLAWLTPRLPNRSSIRVVQIEQLMELPSTPAKEVKTKPPKFQTSGKLVWKGNYRRIITRFFEGIECPKGSLNKVLCGLARFAPHYLTFEDARAVMGQFVREIPQEGWGASSRLETRNLGRIDKDIGNMLAKAFAGNMNQNDPAMSQKKITACVERFGEIGFSPFDKTTWHVESRAAVKVKIAWTNEEKNEFFDALSPYLPRHVNPVDVVDDAVELVLQKEREENGISLAYWAVRMEDRFGVPTTDTRLRKHQKIVKALLTLDVLAIHQKSMSRLATRYTTGKRTNDRAGWKTRELTAEKKLGEVMGETSSGVAVRSFVS